MSSPYGGLIIILNYGKGFSFTPPPPPDSRITDDFNPRITDDGNLRVTDS